MSRQDTEDVSGFPPSKATWSVSRWLFLRVLGLAHVGNALWFLDQWPGHLGSRGIRPLLESLNSISASFGTSSFWKAPSLFWISASDEILGAVAVANLALAVSLAFGLASRFCCSALFGVWLSIVSSEALSTTPVVFNWPFDEFLLETTFLAILMAPRGFWPRFDEWPMGAWSRWLDSPWECLGRPRATPSIR